ncbi:MAG TPA: fibronectin type III domain-containing protein [Chloroflexia bacterium]|nr:fibronectin type III domain-containing protein [Chloroflexia bacterium]
MISLKPVLARSARYGLLILSLLLIGLLATCSNATPTGKAQGPVAAGCQIFPADNIWNVPVTNLPVDPNSNAYINSIGANTGLHPDFGSGTWQGAPIGIPYIGVPQNQPGVPVSFTYASESDPGPYPIPANAPIEGGSGSSGDRHVIVVQQGSCSLYETWSSYPQNGGTSWQDGSGALFNLNSNALRPANWTSADAAGLPILPGLARYSEAQAGNINHALRFTVVRTRNTYVWPARHQASSYTSLSYPPMGQRFRLKAGYVIPANFSPQTKAILQALKTYGMIVADNGSNWYISGEPNSGWDDNALVNELATIKGLNFEAVDSSSLMINPDSAQAAVAPTGTPSGLAASVYSASQINLSWVDNSVNESGFYIERSTSPSGSFSQVGSVPANTTTFSSSGLADGTIYYYRVRAYNSYGTSPYSGLASQTTPFIAPTGLTASAVGPRQVNLSWNDNSSGEDGYYIERAATSNGTFTLIGTTGSNATGYQDQTVLDGSDYYYRVRAFNSSGNSAYSNQGHAQTPLAQPTGLLVWATAANQVNLQWTDNSRSEEGYIVERSPDGVSSWNQVGTTTGPDITTFTDNVGLNADTGYFYRVKAHKTTGDSPYSANSSVVTTVWQVSVSQEDGLGTTANTLSNALAGAVSGQTIMVEVDVQFNLQSGMNWTYNLRQGVNLVGNCGSGGPTVTIDGSGLPDGTNGLVLNHNNIIGLTISHFPGQQLKTAGTDNFVRCTRLVK